jgi:osmotically-inducible protein OsmY
VLNRSLPLIATLLASSVLLSGCAGMLIGAGATAGVATVQERGFGGAVDDTKIRADVNSAWIKKDGEMFRKVDLSIYEGRVMLTGIVKKDSQRDDAVQLTWQAAGVREVINEIQVIPAGQDFSDYSHDTWIQQKLQTILLFDKEVKNVNYVIDVVGGVVYLLGLAQDQTEMNRVIAQASDISGVKRVVNHILLKSDPHRVE